MMHHFATNDDADLDFLAYVVGKVNNIRDDLGSTGEVFDEALTPRRDRGIPPWTVLCLLFRKYGQRLFHAFRAPCPREGAIALYHEFAHVLGACVLPRGDLLEHENLSPVAYKLSPLR